MVLAGCDAPSRVDWFNEQLFRVKYDFVRWLEELGHTVNVSEKRIEKVEAASGEYHTWMFDCSVDGVFVISIIPEGIWIIGAGGRIDFRGPSGIERLLYLFGEKASDEYRAEAVCREGRDVSRLLGGVYEDGWYWYHDSSFRDVSKFSKETISPLLERLG